MKTRLRLILGDQLNENHPWFDHVDKSVVYTLMETRSETDYVVHHVQKICAFFLAMRKFAVRLQELGHQVIYIELDDPNNEQDFCLNLKTLAKSVNAKEIEYQLPDEYRLDRLLSAFKASSEIQVTAFDSHHFITSRSFLSSFFTGKKQYLMESFYREIRRQTGLLMDGDRPEGNKWNFDHDNRGTWKGSPAVPVVPTLEHATGEITSVLQALGVNFFGELTDYIHLPLTRSESMMLLDHFCQHQLPYFGKYQDAMHSKEPTLFHSLLSFSMNVKLINPLEVCKAVEDAFKKGLCELAQAEGFIRQIIGWREYMRGIYWAQMPEYYHLNFFDHDAPLPNWFWTGNTHMNCLKHAIGQSLDTAYAHHIQRLMVIGNFALLAGIHPDALDSWYLGVYADAIEWVQITNTRGMSQFADGGIVGTKPYVSTANYIGKMSNYCNDCKYDATKRTGENACPFNSLYWDFYERHRDKLERNARIGIMYRTLDKMGSETRKEIMQHAAYIKGNLNSL